MGWHASMRDGVEASGQGFGGYRIAPLKFAGGVHDPLPGSTPLDTIRGLHHALLGSAQLREKLLVAQVCEVHAS